MKSSLFMTLLGIGFFGITSFATAQGQSAPSPQKEIQNFKKAQEAIAADSINILGQSDYTMVTLGTQLQDMESNVHLDRSFKDMLQETQDREVVERVAGDFR
jgi:hypothetical protein